MRVVLGLNPVCTLPSMKEKKNLERNGVINLSNQNEQKSFRSLATFIFQDKSDVVVVVVLLI